MQFRILENTEVYSPWEFKKFIGENCKEYLELRKYGTKLYRGMKGAEFTYMVKTPRPNRDPKDTPYEIHDLFNEALYKKFGWYPRSEGIFVTSSRGGASAYGNVYEIYPTDGFKYIWSPHVRDFYDYYVMHEPKKREDIPDFIEDVVYTYIDKDIERAAKMVHEIMIKCDKYACMDANIK